MTVTEEGKELKSAFNAETALAPRPRLHLSRTLYREEMDPEGNVEDILHEDTKLMIAYPGTMELGAFLKQICLRVLDDAKEVSARPCDVGISSPYLISYNLKLTNTKLCGPGDDDSDDEKEFDVVSIKKISELDQNIIFRDIDRNLMDAIFPDEDDPCFASVCEGLFKQAPNRTPQIQQPLDLDHALSLL